MHVCATCDAIIPLARERCDACNARIGAETAATIARERKEQKRSQAMKSLLIAGTLALSLAGAAHANTPPLDYHGHPFPPITHDRSCTITHAWEDLSAVAQCRHHVWAFDPDGGFNREPQTWYRFDGKPKGGYGR